MLYAFGVELPDDLEPAILDRVYSKMYIVQEIAQRATNSMVKGSVKYQTDHHTYEEWLEHTMQDSMDACIYPYFVRDSQWHGQAPTMGEGFFQIPAIAESLGVREPQTSNYGYRDAREGQGSLADLKRYAERTREFQQMRDAAMVPHDRNIGWPHDHGHDDGAEHHSHPHMHDYSTEGHHHGTQDMDEHIALDHSGRPSIRELPQRTDKAPDLSRFMEPAKPVMSQEDFEKVYTAEPEELIHLRGTVPNANYQHSSHKYDTACGLDARKARITLAKSQATCPDCLGS